MSGPHDHVMEMTPLDQFDPNFAVYDNQFTSLQRTSDPSTPYEGFGFWYRPDNQETIYSSETAFSQQSRPIPPPAMDMPLALKHKRTRSGCFTCRQRRVKCDETKPVCDRCRKGNRQCEFPSKTSGSKKSKNTVPTSPTVERGRLEQGDVSGSIKEESEDETSEAEEDESSPKPKYVVASPVQTSTTSQFPTKSSGRTNTTSTPPADPLNTSTAALWKGLKPEVQKYIQFQRNYMTHYHYSFKVDSENFIHDELISLAIQFEPLLYAVVAFAAYHHTVRLSDDAAEFSSFWKYYCKSIVKLRQYLESNKERNDLVLLTVLQLATFEEYMGDWNSLVSHHKAASGIILSKYTPQSIMETDRGRKIFDWYIRLDVIAGLMAVRDTVLDRSWVVYAYEWHEKRSDLVGPNQLQKKQEFFTKAIELIGHDTAHLFAGASEALASFDSGQPQNFSIDEVMSGVSKLSDRLDKLRRRIQELHDPSMTGADLHDSPDQENSVFASHVPLFRGALWPLNFVWVDWYGVMILLKNSMLATLQKASMTLQAHSLPSVQIENLQQQALNVLPELGRYSKTQCEIYNALSTSTTAPEGVTIVCYAAVALSTVFLPKAPPAQNSRYTMWARKQLAGFERQGFIWPPHFRKEMANLWGDPEIEDWWLPNGEGKTRIIEEIRSVVVDRTLIAQRKEKPGQDQGRDLREIKGLFEMMDLGRRGSIDALSASARLDPSYVSSPAGMLNAASMVSTPGSSTDSMSGFTSPRGSVSEIQGAKQTSRGRQQSQGSIGGGAIESPVVQSKTAPSSNRMSGIWEDEQK